MKAFAVSMIIETGNLAWQYETGIFSQDLWYLPSSSGAVTISESNVHPPGDQKFYGVDV